MECLGDKLREAREARGITVDQLAAATKIRSDYLLALEQGDRSSLPGDVYVRGFLRLYAREVGLDADAVVAEYGKARRQLLGEADAVRWKPLPFPAGEPAVYRRLPGGPGPWAVGRTGRRGTGKTGRRAWRRVAAVMFVLFALVAVVLRMVGPEVGLARLVGEGGRFTALLRERALGLQTLFSMEAELTVREASSGERGSSVAAASGGERSSGDAARDASEGVVGENGLQLPPPNWDAPWELSPAPLAVTPAEAEEEGDGETVGPEGAYRQPEERETGSPAGWEEDR